MALLEMITRLLDRNWRATARLGRERAALQLAARKLRVGYPETRVLRDLEEAGVNHLGGPPSGGRRKRD